MTPQNWLRIGLLVLALIGSFRLGANLKQGEWDRSENERLREVAAALDRQKRITDDLNEELSAAELSLAEAEFNARELNDALQAEITREPVTTVVTVERDNCPKVELTVPDAGQYFRLFNCGISGDCEAESPAEADLIDGAVPTPEPTARLDGGPRPFSARTDF